MLLHTTEIMALCSRNLRRREQNLAELGSAVLDFHLRHTTSEPAALRDCATRFLRVTFELGHRQIRLLIRL